MKFIYTAAGMVNAETLQEVEFTSKYSKYNPMYYIDHFFYYAKIGWDKFVEDYYEFIGWAFSELTRLVTTIPTDLIGNQNSIKMQAIFMGYGALMIVFLAIAEGYKAIMGINYTKPSVIFGRTFIALIGAGLTMPAVIWLIKCSNMAVQMVLYMGETYFNGSSDLGSLLRDFSASGVGNFFASILFMIVFLYFIVHALFKVGIRWFDLLMNMVGSPFAWASYVTNGTAKHLASWMAGTGKLILINLVYAFYVSVISVVIMGPGPVESFGGWVARMLLLVGGLYRLANPPAWIQSMDAQGTLSPMLKRLLKMTALGKLRVAK